MNAEAKLTESATYSYDDEVQELTAEGSRGSEQADDGGADQRSRGNRRLPRRLYAKHEKASRLLVSNKDINSALEGQRPLETGMKLLLKNTACHG